MGRKQKGRCTRNNPAGKSAEPEELVKAPHSFVFNRGVVGRGISQLTLDMRRLMDPFTATNLKARKKNTIKDFVAVSGPLHVSHMLIFTQTVLSPYLRLVRLPRGPTLTFKLHNYCLAKDVLSSLRKQYAFHNIFSYSPLAVLNGFSSDDPQVKLMIATFQGMFPTINVTTVKLKNITRCVLFNYDPETKLIDFRHYVVKAIPTGISKAVKKLNKRNVPDLSNFLDVSEFMTRSEVLSESEAEEDPGSQVTAPQSIRRVIKGNKAAVRLLEYGPRLTLQLIKVEAGVMEGEVMYHEFITKTDEEKALIKKRLEEKRKLKEKRKKEQEANVRRKLAEREEAKKKSLEGMRRAGVVEAAGEPSAQVEPDDDAEWYRKEVGQEPQPELFQPGEKKSILKRKGGGDQRADRPIKQFKSGPKIKWSSDVKAPNEDFKKARGDIKQPTKPRQDHQMAARGGQKKARARKGKAKKVVHNKAKKVRTGTKVKKGKRQR